MLRPQVQKSHPVDDVQAVIDWGNRHWFCQACGADWRPLQNHHIIGGRGGRSDEPCNLLRLCGHPCHDLAGGLDVRRLADTRMTYHDVYLPKLTLAIQLTIKKMLDPEEWNEMRLTVLHGRRLPDPEPIPEWFAKQFYTNRPELRS